MIFSVGFPALKNQWNESGIIAYGRNQADLKAQKIRNQKYAVLGESVINIDIAATSSDRTRGLSGRESIDHDYGLFFVFEESGYHGIWMKDMHFPIDIIWIDESMRINHIEKNVKPESFPKVFTPKKKSRYVLELNAGYVDKNGIRIGDQIDLL